MSTHAKQQERKGRKAVTLSDLALALGVSKGTVSMALSGSSLVAESTRQTVLAKAKELGYVYNRSAASLSTGVTGLVGLAVHNLTNPYFTRVCSAIEHELEQKGKFALLCNLDESLEKQARFLQALREQNADGLIICPAIGTKAEDLAVFDDVGPIVLFARGIDYSQYDYVGNDDLPAMKRAALHILDRGHRRIGFIHGGDSTSVSRLRLAGYLAALKEHGLEAEPQLMVEVPLLPEGGDRGVRQLMDLPEPPTAIVCMTDYLAIGAISALHSLGYLPGRDVAVIGCDGIPEGEHAYLNLSTISVQKQVLGRKAAQLLQARLQNPDKDIETVRLAPVDRFRSSSGDVLPSVGSA